MVSAVGVPGLIDTDILIDVRRGYSDGVKFVAAQRAAFGVSISVVSAMELVAGCRDGSALARLQAFLAALEVLPLSPAISRMALHWMETFTLSHGLTIPDSLIAATAACHALPLFTKNIRHFQMLPGLQVIRPY